MRKYKKMVLIFMGICLKSFSMEIFPTQIYLEGKGNTQTKELMIYNPGTKPTRVEISSFKPDGALDEFYIGEDVRIYPKTLSLKPQERKIARVSIKTTPKMSDGEYIAGISFKEISNSVSELEEEDTKGIVMDMKVLKNVKIVAYRLVGDRKVFGELKSITATKINGNIGKLKTTITPKGNSSLVVKYDLKYLDKSGKVLGENKGYLGRVERGSTGNLETEIGVIPQGTTNIKINVTEAAGQKFGEHVLKI